MRPLPFPDELTQPYWDGAKDHRLMIQRCARCRSWQHPPSLFCAACSSQDLAAEEASGRGALHAWTVLHDAPAPGFADRLPLIIAVVELDEQAGLMLGANLIDAAPADLRLGLAVEGAFETVTPEGTLPQFRRAER